MRTVSFIGPDDGRSGAGITDTFDGTGGGCGGWENLGGTTSRAAGVQPGPGSTTMGKGGLRSAHTTASRFFAFGSADCSTGSGAPIMRVVSFFGSFGSAIWRND